MTCANSQSNKDGQTCYGHQPDKHGRCLRCGYMGSGGTIGSQPMLLRVQPRGCQTDHVLVTWEHNDVETVSVVRVHWSSTEGDIDIDQVGDPPRVPEVVMRELLEGLRERYHANRDMTVDGLVELVWG